MALPTIEVQLTKFQQIEILRTEIELREQELKQTEKTMREVLYEAERQKYLQTVHPIFAQLPQPEQVQQLPQLTANREALGQAVEAMKAALTKLEAETVGQTAPRAAGAVRAPGGGLPPKPSRFSTF